jgi:hypothetical protein
VRGSRIVVVLCILDEGCQASRRMISQMVSATRMAAKTRKIPDSMPWKAQYRVPERVRQHEAGQPCPEPPGRAPPRGLG